ncbi:putative amino acid/amine transport protein [Klebsiella pneumoniae]|uniref:Putative amino acid/amine transport protein n=1 Tax=Klebsiella pneumoniae TaxID=573 RepID=A0A378F6D0_KLEPN|nr:putative amino acid/amine transport protein [Klebsiella pneumoniae]
MAMFMFVGCELVTPMAPEIKQAHRTIPRAMRWACWGRQLHVYLRRGDQPQVENTVLDAANNVHLLDTPWRSRPSPNGDGPRRPVLAGVGLLLAGCATINTLMAAVPRIIYGMALGRRAAPFPDLAASAL